jgi:putative hemolysin
MTALSLEILLIILLITANGVFSGSEIAVVSSRKVRLEQLAKGGNKSARLALKLANSPNDFLSTVQIGITLIGILSGAIGGATLVEHLERLFATIPSLAAYRQPLSIVIVVTIITYLSLVVGELVPKRIALNNPEQFASRVAGPMRLLSFITAPVVHLLSLSTDGLLNLLGIQASEAPAITEEEIKVLMQQGTQAGMFEEAEEEMISRIFRLGDRSISTLMTPRTSIAWLDIDASSEENQREIMEYTYSRFPVGKGSLDNCLGIVRVKDLLSAYLTGEPVDLQKILKTPLFIPESTRALNVLETFKQSGTHIALITDEYGGIEGLVTLNDMVEAIVGELPSIEELNEPQIIQREDGSWLLDGLLSVDELKELLNWELLPDEEEGYYQTLGGFVMAVLRRIPMASDHFEVNGFRFEVMDMDGTRVDKVLVTPLPAKNSNEV